jgi:SpoVK/Ycf46/Vps4 family AAA+-type ATPase
LKRAGLALKAITLLHEMYHVKLEKQGYRGKDLEAVCDDYAARAFKEIFGREYKMPANILDTVREEWKR